MHNKINKIESEIDKVQNDVFMLVQKMGPVELDRAISYSNKVRRLDNLYKRLYSYLNVLEKTAE